MKQISNIFVNLRESIGKPFKVHNFEPCSLTVEHSQEIEMWLLPHNSYKSFKKNVMRIVFYR